MIGFAGLSHLGIVSSVATASKGFEVIAYHPDAELCARLSSGNLPLFEPGLAELLAAHRERIRFTADPRELGGCDVVYLSIDMPSEEDDRSALHDLADDVRNHAAPAAVLVLLSQVRPGTTRQWIKGFRREGPLPKGRMFYQVETLIFGQAIQRATQPERIIVGCDDPSATLPVAYDRLLSAFRCPVLRMSYESAELSKIAINVCLAASVTAANTLAELCETTGADWSEIVPALRLDPRIGPHAYLSPGLGIAGGNLERDLRAVQQLAETHGTDAVLADACLANSDHRRNWLAKTLHSAVLSRKPSPVIAVWGLSYKANTSSVQNSASMDLLQTLAPLPVRAFDPEAQTDGAPSNLVRVGSALDACCGADVLVIATPWPQFARQEPNTIAALMRGRVILDPFGILDGPRWEAAGFAYFRLGCMRKMNHSGRGKHGEDAEKRERHSETR